MCTEAEELQQQYAQRGTFQSAIWRRFRALDVVPFECSRTFFRPSCPVGLESTPSHIPHISQDATIICSVLAVVETCRCTRCGRIRAALPPLLESLIVFTIFGSVFETGQFGVLKQFLEHPFRSEMTAQARLHTLEQAADRNDCIPPNNQGVKFKLQW